VAKGGESPSVAYGAPMRGPDGQVACVAILLVRATAIWERIRASHGIAGPGSYAALFDNQGVRIAHSYSDESVFHPAGRLEPPWSTRWWREQRFGARTRALLEDVRAFPEQFERARAEVLDREIFLGFAPVNQTTNYGVGRRFETAPWTLFYMVPEANVQAQISRHTWLQIALALAIMGWPRRSGCCSHAASCGPWLHSAQPRRRSQGATCRHGSAMSVRASWGSLPAASTPWPRASRSSRGTCSVRAMNSNSASASAPPNSRTAPSSCAPRWSSAGVPKRRSAKMQELLQAIIDNTAAVIFVKDLQGRYMMVNRRYCELFHVTEADIVGKSDADLHTAEEAACRS
jgi:PAS domain-containing protein